MIKKAVIVTGGTNGIGQATAVYFAKHGYDVGVTFNTTSPTEVEKECISYGSKVLAIKMDLKSEVDIIEAFEKFFNFFPYVETVVCNAGIAEKEELLAYKSTKEIDEVLSVNLRGTILCNREALKYFIEKKRGNIVNNASIYGLYGSSCESVYSAAKGGIVALTKALAIENGGYGIRINAVAPGYIVTNMTKSYSESDIENIVPKIPLSKMGTADEVAAAIYFLGSEQASYITGEVLEIGGGAIRF